VPKFELGSMCDVDTRLTFQFGGKDETKKALKKHITFRLDADDAALEGARKSAQGRRGSFMAGE